MSQPPEPAGATARGAPRGDRRPQSAGRRGFLHVRSRACPSNAAGRAPTAAPVIGRSGWTWAAARSYAGADRDFSAGAGAHDGAGYLMAALAIGRDDRPRWEARSGATGVAVVLRTAYAVYVDDPEGNPVGPYSLARARRGAAGPALITWMTGARGDPPAVRGRRVGLRGRAPRRRARADRLRRPGRVQAVLRVKVVSGEEHLTPFNPAERKHLGNVYFITKLRLSCQARIPDDADAAEVMTGYREAEVGSAPTLFRARGTPPGSPGGATIIGRGGAAACGASRAEKQHVPASRRSWRRAGRPRNPDRHQLRRRREPQRGPDLDVDVAASSPPTAMATIKWARRRRIACSRGPAAS